MRIGFLPKELPPVFSSAALAATITDIEDNVKKDWTRPVSYVLGRPGGMRRRITIPNPFNQLKVARLCDSSWGEIESHLAMSEISLTTPRLDGMHGRAASPQVHFGERHLHRTLQMSSARYVLRTDISQFYASVYTHSIEWALSGKESAKAGAGSRRNQSLGARLDKAVAAGQDGQTSGIPIGPDTSLVLAEILLSRVDAAIQAVNPRVATSAIRYMDDLEFYASSRSEAEELLLAWEAELAALELLVNPAKTCILEAPLPLFPRWRSLLDQFVISEKQDDRSIDDVIGYFSLAFELARESPNESVLAHAVGRFATGNYSPNTWTAIIRLLLAAVVAEPTCLRSARSVLRSGDPACVERHAVLICRSLNEIIEFHSRLQHASEVAWALSIILERRLRVSAAAALSVGEMTDNACLLLLLHLHQEGLFEDSAVSIAHVLVRAEAEDVCTSVDWLLGYECAARGWVNPRFVNADPRWAGLIRAGVTFTTPNQAAPKSVPRHPAAGVGASSSDVADATLVDDQRSTEPDVPPPSHNPTGDGPDTTAPATSVLEPSDQGPPTPAPADDATFVVRPWMLVGY